MNVILKTLTLFISLIALGGCAHNIQLTPPLDEIRDAESIEKIDKHVGYYISKEDLAKEVTSPGGGGDKVKYLPYKDTETAINTMLSKIFTKVYSVKDLNDSEFFSARNISYIFKSSIKTDSSSSSLVTWPPTKFEFELTCIALNLDGSVTWQKTVSTIGNAEFSEFKNDLSLSARRASSKAFQKMLTEISNAKELKL